MRTSSSPLVSIRQMRRVLQTETIQGRLGEKGSSLKLRQGQCGMSVKVKKQDRRTGLCGSKQVAIILYCIISGWMDMLDFLITVSTLVDVEEGTSKGTYDTAVIYCRLSNQPNQSDL